MAYTTDTDSNYGSAPYHEAAQRARARLGWRDAILAGLSGLGSVQPGSNFGQAFLSAAGGSARATWAAQQAAMNYAQRQQEQKQQAEMDAVKKTFMEGQIAAMNKPPKEEKPPPPPKPEKLVTIAGPDGKPIYVRESDAVGKSAYVKPATPRAGAAPKAPKPPKPPSAAEKSNAGVLSAASKAEISLRAQEDKVGNDFISQARLKLPNVAQTAAEQQYVQAQNWWIENVLRQVSGAAISPKEYADYRQIYFAQPGDHKETRNQKRASRQAILDKLRGMAGAAAPSAPSDTSLDRFVR